MNETLCLLAGRMWIITYENNLPVHEYCASGPSGPPLDWTWLWWVIGGAVLFFLWGLIPDWHEQKRDESADIMTTRRGYWTQIEEEWWAIKGGKGDRSKVDRLEAELKAFEDTTEIAPGEGVYLRKKRR